MQLLHIKNTNLKFNASQLFLDNNRIMINKADRGLLFLDTHFHDIQYIPINSWLTLDTVFFKNNGSAVFIYDSDENLFNYVCLLSGNIYTKNTKYNHIIFNQYFFWHDNNLIMISNDNHVYFFSEITKKFIGIENNIVKTQYTSFFNFWHDTQNMFPLYWINNYMQQLIYGDQSNNRIVWYDYAKNKITVIPMPTDMQYVQIRYHQGVFMFLAEYELRLVKGTTTISHITTPGKCYYRAAEFLIDNNTIFIVALMVHEHDHHGELIKYQLTFE